MTARIMEHEEAIKNLAAERYLLGELTESEREAYEEHLFSCAACFEQVKAGTEFVGQIRRIGAEEPVAKQVPARFAFLAGLRQPVTALALTLLIFVSGISLHQHEVILGLKQPRALPTSFLSDGAKGDGPESVTVRPNSWFGLNVQLLEKGNFPAYEGQILSESGQLRSPFPIPEEQTSKTIPVLLNSSDLRPGTYQLIINGLSPDGRKAEVARYSFQLKLQE